jgi:hypothetical protein
MVKSGSDRSDKYGQKFDPAVVQLRYTATMESSKAKQVAMQQALALKNGSVRAILNQEGVFPIQTVQYQAFGNKLFGICNKFAGLMTTPTLSNTATTQAEVERTKWLSYGSEKTILDSIWALYADMLGACPSP